MKFGIKSIFLLVTLVAIVLGIWKLWWQSWGEGVVTKTISNLESLDSVDAVEIFGFWDSPLDYKIVSVSVQLIPVGRLVISYPTIDMRTQFGIDEIGQYYIRVAPAGQIWDGSSQFGEVGSLKHLLPKGVISVKDVIENYEKVLDSLKQLPDSQENALRVPGKNGGTLVWKTKTSNNRVPPVER